MPKLLAAACAAGVGLCASTASAAVVWTGDFETGDTSQWNYLLNPEIDGVTYINVVDDVVAQGMYAVRVELHDDAIWPGNMLRRVELQHHPDDARTAEGFTDYVAWSFYLPETLPEDPGQTIAYWESDGSYQQMMAFDVAGERLSFTTRRPDNVLQWEADVATAGQWHRIAMRLLWSTDGAVGQVDVYFDGELVVDQASAQTLADVNPMFMQMGLLRGNFDFDDVPVIYLDYALEGDSLRDVAFDELPGGGDESGSSGGEGSGSSGSGGGSGSGGSGGDTTGGPSGTSASTEGSGTGPATSGGSGSGSDTDGAPGDGDDEAGGCGCRHAGSGAAWLLWGVPFMARRRGTRGRAARRGP